MRIKFALTLFMLLITLSAFGADRFANLHPGISCINIPEIERQLGSVELTFPTPAGISEFSGTQGGKKAKITYRCVDGKLSEQTVTVTTSSREEAYRFAHEQTVEISGRLGKPMHDGPQLATWRRLLFGALGADLDYLTAVVVWGRADEDLMLSVREAAENRWQVSISQGSSKLEYIINS